MPLYQRPAQIAFKAATTTARAMTTASPTIIYETVAFDTANAYNSTTGQYTVPVAGVYLVTVSFSTNGTGTAYGVNNMAALTLAKNGSGGDYAAHARAGSTNANLIQVADGAVLVSCVAGDVLTILGYSDVTTTLSGAAIENFFCVSRVA